VGYIFAIRIFHPIYTRSIDQRITWNQATKILYHRIREEDNMRSLLTDIFPPIKNLSYYIRGWRRCDIPEWINTDKFMAFHNGGYIYTIKGRTFVYKINSYNTIATEKRGNNYSTNSTFSSV